MKNQHLTVLNKRRRLEWCTSMLQRLGKAKRLQGASRKTHKTCRFSGHCSLGFSSHLKRSFLCGFLVVFRSECRDVFLVVLVVWCCLPRKICTMFLLCRMFTSRHLLRRCVGKQTPAAPEVQLRNVVWSDESLFRLREQPNHQNTRFCWGRPCLAIVSAPVFFAILGACTASPHIIFKLSVERRVRFWRIFGRFFSSVPLPMIWLSRNTSKIDALDDDETPLRLTASQTATTRGVMVSGIMGVLDIAPTLHFAGPDLKINSKEMDECIVPNRASLMEARA